MNQILPKILRPAVAVALCAGFAFAAAPSTASAQLRQFTGRDQASMTEVFGRGVHAYYDGDYGQADRLLTEVAQAGSRDPRVYYFRAMARGRQGRSFESEQDMRVGAALEARNPSSRRAIARSLMRVQGAARLKLEQFRRQGRLDVAQQHLQQARSRQVESPPAGSSPGGPSPRERQVLRQPTPVPLDQLSQPSVNLVKPATATQPAAAPTEAPPVATTPQPTTPQPAASRPSAPASSTPESPTPAPSTDAGPGPFGGASAPANLDAQPASSDATPDHPPASQPPPSNDDVFSDPTPSPSDSDAVDVFGADATPPEAAPTAEPESVEPAAANDPFGGLDAFGDSPQPSEAPADDPQPAGPAPANPTPAGSEADQPAEGDPFGDAFGSDPATPPSDAPAETSDASSASSGEAKPGKFLGVLGRIVGGAVPDVSAPELPKLPPVGPPTVAPPAGGPQAGAFELGPGDDAFAPGARPGEMQPPAAGQATPQQPAAEGAFDDEDPFGGAAFDAPAETPPPQAAAPPAAGENLPGEAESVAEETDADAGPAETESSDSTDSNSQDDPLDEDPFSGLGDF